MCSLKYVTLNDAIQTILPLGRRTLLPKIDIDLPQNLLTSWQTCWSEILQQQKILSCIHYLDDFLTIGPPKSSSCQQNLGTIKHVCEWLGIPLALKKVKGPSTSLKFFGITLDTIRMEAHLPADKLQRTSKLVSSWMFKKKASKSEILSLIGVLQHATRIVQPGKTFLSRMYATAAKLHELHFYTRLNKEFRSDLCWWDIFLESWNGLSLLQCTTTLTIETHDFSIQTDVSGSWGCGAFFQGNWLQLKVYTVHSTHHVQGITTHCSQLWCGAHYWFDTKYYSSVITVVR